MQKTDKTRTDNKFETDKKTDNKWKKLITKN